MIVDDVVKIIKERLSEKRFIHSYNVMLKCEELARIYGADIEQAKLIGISHDIAKELNVEEVLNYIADNNIDADEIEKDYVWLLHGKIGAYICKKEFGYTNEMTRAIAIHTTGDANMTLLDKILFIADYMADDISNEENEEEFKNIDRMVLDILNYKIKKTIEKGTITHIKSIIARNDIISKMTDNEL